MRKDDPVQIGVMFSTTGWTAVTEQCMLEASSFAIEEINQSGGINGRKLVPVCRDPAGDPAAYQEMASDLLSDGQVKVILGCYTSSQRKAVLSVLERESGLLCYPAQYEGFEYSENILYFGAVPNQNSQFLAQYLLRDRPPRVYIVGSDYVWPRESGRIMADLIRSGGGEILGETYLGDKASAADFHRMICHIADLHPDVIFNNFVGQSNLDFYDAYTGHGLNYEKIMVASLTTSEADLRAIPPGAATGHITAATYFGSQMNPGNTAVLKRFLSEKKHPASANMSWDAAYTQAHMVAQAMRKNGTDSVSAIRSGILTSRFEALQGRIEIDPTNLHCYVWPKIGIARADGQFDIVARTEAAIRPDPYRITYEIGGEGGVAATAPHATEST